MKLKLWPLWRRIGHFRSDSDLEDELRAHLQLSADDNLASGMTEGEARRRAHLQLGRTRSILESLRDQEFITALESWYGDLVLGIRALGRSPVFCLTSILTLALGIGANTGCVFCSVWASFAQLAGNGSGPASACRVGKSCFCV